MFCILVYKIQERNTFLWNTIGYLDKEYEALITGYVLLGVSTFWIIFGGTAEAYFFSLYNGKYHPFADILIDSVGKNLQIKIQVQKVHLRKIFCVIEIPLVEIKVEMESKFTQTEISSSNESDRIDTEGKRFNLKYY